MKKIIILLLILLISTVFANTCPYNEINCEYPGKCGAYTDSNNDGYCDYSQVEEIEVENTENIEELHIELTGNELKTKTVEEVAIIYGINPQEYAYALQEVYSAKIEPEDNFQTLHDNLGIEPSIVKNIATSLATNTRIEIEEIQQKITENANTATKPKYEFILLSILTIVIYFFTYSLYRAKKITLLNHRRFWNWILLITFLISCLLGILLVIRINYGFSFNLPFNILYWHVEAGIVMTIISLFHAFWHINYYKTTFKKTK